MPFKGFLQFLWKMHSHLIVSNIAILSDTGFTKRQTRRPLAYMLWCNGLGNRPRKKWSLFKGCKLPFKKPRVSQPDLETLAPVKFWELCVLFSFICPVILLLHLLWPASWLGLSTNTLQLYSIVVSLIIKKTKTMCHSRDANGHPVSSGEMQQLWQSVSTYSSSECQEFFQDMNQVYGFVSLY